MSAMTVDLYVGTNYYDISLAEYIRMPLNTAGRLHILTAGVCIIYQPMHASQTGVALWRHFSHQLLRLFSLNYALWR